MAHVIFGNTNAKAGLTEDGITSYVAVPGNRETSLMVNEEKLSAQFAAVVRAWPEFSDSEPSWLEASPEALKQLLLQEWPDCKDHRPEDWARDTSKVDVAATIEQNVQG